MSTCLIVAPCNKGSDIAIDEASHAALLELLKREKHSLYVCGRAYLTNLTKWRDHFQGISDHPLSAERNVVPGTSCLTSAQSGRNATPLSSSSIFDAPDNKARPNRNPEILLNWRARVIAWYFDFVQSRNHEFNTALAAISYLDVYSMSVSFPTEFRRIINDEESASFTHSNTITGGDGCFATPSPSKKSKTEYLHFEGYIADNADHSTQQETLQCDDSIQGMDIIQYRLAAVSSLYLACKVFQSVPTIATSLEFANAMGDGTVSPEQIEDMEFTILNALSFRVHVPTAVRFINELLPLLIPHRNCSSTWVPQGDVEERVVSDATMLATLASFCGSEKVPVLISATPSKIALAAIIEGAKRVFHQETVFCAQQTIMERLFSQQIIPYTVEVADIQQCLVDLQRLNEQKGKESYTANTVSHSNKASVRPGTPLNSCDIADKVQDACTSKSKLGINTDPTKTYTNFRRTVSQSSDEDSPKNISSKCSKGRIHRAWESIEQCVSAANATSYYFAAEMETAK